MDIEVKAVNEPTDKKTYLVGNDTYILYNIIRELTEEIKNLRIAMRK